jgi:hypothetical protein
MNDVVVLAVAVVVLDKSELRAGQSSDTGQSSGTTRYHRHTPQTYFEVCISSTVHLCYVYITSSEETRVNMQVKCGIESFFQYYYVSLSVMIILMYMYRARLDKYQQFLN